MRPKNAAHGPVIANSFVTTVATPSKWVGRAAPQRSAVSPSTCTVVSGGPLGYISATDGANTTSTPSRLALREVAGEVAGIAVEIFARAELQRVDEDRDDDEIAGVAGRAHERPVTLVQEAHRRHEPDPSALRPRAIARGAQVGDRLDVQHRSASLGSGLVGSGLAGLTCRW